MDPTAQKVVRFDRFALDLTRGCLWSDDKEIDLPPKAFQVLTCLVLNAGRLVPKEELLEAAWGSVAVSDESLAQSIRQLRQKLGDHGHGLIKTVSRRGYRLEATLDAQPLQTVPPEQSASAIGRPRVLEAAFATSLMPLRAGRAAKRHIWMAASGFVCVVVAAVYLLAHMPLAHTGLRVSPPAATLLFITDDAARIADIAKSKELPLPAFEIREPARDVPGTVRRFEASGSARRVGSAQIVSSSSL